MQSRSTPQQKIPGKPGVTQQHHLRSPRQTDSHFESLSAAFHKGFALLKWFLIALVVAFAFSNVYWVPEGCVVIHTRFGKIVRHANGYVKAPGGPYFAFPFPIDAISRIPTTLQNVMIDRAFWLEDGLKQDTPKDPFKRYTSEFFTPGKEGSLITADKNLVQGIWNIHFKVIYDHSSIASDSTVIQYVRNVGDTAKAMRIVASLAQDAIVKIVGQTTVRDFVLGNINHDAIRTETNEQLDLLGGGMRVTSVSAVKYAVPRSLTEIFQAVNEAESEKVIHIEEAIRSRVSTLSELAGENWETLLSMLNHLEAARNARNRQSRDSLFAAVKTLILSDNIGGLVNEKINSAILEKTRIVEQARSESAQFLKMLPAYRKNPTIVGNQLLQAAYKHIWSSQSNRTITLPADKTLYLNLDSED
ncbi:MAG: hypothetical protein GF398_19815 [Chitinivibrionales bacterium]|nr:hypothetical protein [Chitinivibrionales bacterium]